MKEDNSKKKWRWHEGSSIYHHLIPTPHPTPTPEEGETQNGYTRFLEKLKFKRCIICYSFSIRIKTEAGIERGRLIVASAIYAVG